MKLSLSVCSLWWNCCQYSALLADVPRRYSHLAETESNATTSRRNTPIAIQTDRWNGSVKMLLTVESRGWRKMKHALRQIRTAFESFASSEHWLADLRGARVKLYVVDYPDTLWNKERPGASYVDLTTLQHSRHAVPRPVLLPVSPAVRHPKLDAKRAARRETATVTNFESLRCNDHEPWNDTLRVKYRLWQDRLPIRFLFKVVGHFIFCSTLVQCIHFNNSTLIGMNVTKLLCILIYLESVYGFSES